MTITITIDDLYKRRSLSQKRNLLTHSGKAPYWILLGGILSGLGSLTLAAIAHARP